MQTTEPESGQNEHEKRRPRRTKRNATAAALDVRRIHGRATDETYLIKAPSTPKKRSRKKAQDLNLDWPCFTPNGLNRTTALEAALSDAENFKLEYPKYAALVDEAVAAKAVMAKK